MNTSFYNILSLQELELHFSLDHNSIHYFTGDYPNFIFCWGEIVKLCLLFCFVFFSCDGLEANIIIIISLKQKIFQTMLSFKKKRSQFQVNLNHLVIKVSL